MARKPKKHIDLAKFQPFYEMRDKVDNYLLLVEEQAKDDTTVNRELIDFYFKQLENLFGLQKTASSSFSELEIKALKLLAKQVMTGTVVNKPNSPVESTHVVHKSELAEPAPVVRMVEHKAPVEARVAVASEKTRGRGMHTVIPSNRVPPLNDMQASMVAAAAAGENYNRSQNDVKKAGGSELNLNIMQSAPKEPSSADIMNE